MTKRLMHVSIATLCLALAYHLGYRNAGAQSPGNPVVGVAAWDRYWLVVTANGDTYLSDALSPSSWQPRVNVFGSATPTEGASMGQVKARWR